MTNSQNLFSERNLTMLVDFYELTMTNGYFESNLKDTIGYFDMFFRKIPDDGGYAIMAGLDQLIEYIKNLKFSKEDLDFLRSKNIFSEDFIKYLEDFEFICDIYAVPEGTPVFPGEPIIIVKGPIIQAQFIETMVLLSINHQTLIATKSNRICRAAKGRPVIEFGARRAQGYDAAIFGARAALIGGCTSTSCTLAEQKFGIPISGTMAHSFVQLYDNEYDAFSAWANIYPNNCTFLVDTYNVLKSGIPNAIKVFNDIIIPKGFRPNAIRIDSGDISYLSKKSRQLLDAAGFNDVKILISNSLDEHIITDVLNQDAPIDAFGVGERLITSKSEPVFGGVYKLVAINGALGDIIPKIKLSENISKITTPGFKKIYRFFSKDSGKALADLITLNDEIIDDSKDITIFDPNFTWKSKTLSNYYAKELLVKVFDKGVCVYNSPSPLEIKEYSHNELEKFWPEILRLDNPTEYYVDLSEKLWNIKQDLLFKLSI